MSIAFASFETALGTAAVAWSDRGIVRTFLPEPSAQAARARLARRLPDALVASCHSGPTTRWVTCSAPQPTVAVVMSRTDSASAARRQVQDM